MAWNKIQEVKKTIQDSLNRSAVFVRSPQYRHLDLPLLRLSTEQLIGGK
jgi:hypothetical protein